mgnify:CR=1 FL=1
MSNITNLLQKHAATIIAEMPAKFTTRQFIWKLSYEYQADYVEMLIEAYNEKNENPQIFLNLHSQIGRYLLNHAEELNIEKLGEIKEPAINPFGRETPTQLWEKR